MCVCVRTTAQSVRKEERRKKVLVLLSFNFPLLSWFFRIQHVPSALGYYMVEKYF